MVEADECQSIGSAFRLLYYMRGYVPRPIEAIELGSSFIPDQHAIVLPRVSSHTQPMYLALNYSASNTFSFAKTHFCMTFS
jgi:hypothetical protein